MSITHSEQLLPENSEMARKRVQQEVGEHYEFGLRLREAVIGVGLVPGEMNYTKIGKELGVSGAMLSYMLNGVKLPGLDKAVGIALRTGICVEWLLTGRGPKRPLTIGPEGAPHVPPEAAPYIEQTLQRFQASGAPDIWLNFLEGLKDLAQSKH